MIHSSLLLRPGLWVHLYLSSDLTAADVRRIVAGLTTDLTAADIRRVVASLKTLVQEPEP